MNPTANPRKRTVHIEVGTDARSYISGGQRVTLVPLTIKHRQNRKLLIPPAPDAIGATGGLDAPMIKTLRGIGEYKIDRGPGSRIYLAKDGLKIIIPIGGGTKKRQQQGIDQALAL